ncbi:MAG: glycosyltransferase [Chitinispirillaceae bacterium]|nr:glycosyltransferase [Chitinispirillaceae bacterium]
MSVFDLSIIIPCLNEEESIATCVKRALEGVTPTGLTGEVIVVDNGSTDRSVQRAADAGARVVHEQRKGYGSAYLRGISESSGRFLVFGDGDNTYDFRTIPSLIAPLQNGMDMVLGSRFKGSIEKGAMSFSHRHIGNPLLTALLNLFFHSSVSDAHTGLRAIRREALMRLNLKTTGMEFASEMIVAALRTKLHITEIPIVYSKRMGASKLNSLSDAWRHLRFMLLFSPTWLFLLPGALLFSGGGLLLVLSGWGKLVFFHHIFDIHAMVFFVLFCLLGFQIIMVGLYAKAFSLREGFEPRDFFLDTFGHIVSLERGIVVGLALFLTGFSASLYLVVKWVKVNFIGPFFEIKLCLFALLFMLIGIQIVFSSFFLSLLKIPRK